MFKQLKIKNIQSHKETTLDFDNGINVIIGSSNQGKSAILRSLYWLIYNRPLGIDTLCSHWNLTDKDNIKDEMSVTLTTNENTVTRKRTKADNQYIVNDKELNVVKSDVPEEVANALNITNVNIQKQLDAPFLLSETNGEIAKYFNKLVRLDVIDKVLVNAESTKRKIKHDVEYTESTINDYTSRLEKYNWLDKVDILLQKYNRVEGKNTKLKNEVNLLKQQIDKYNGINNVSKHLKSVISLSDDIEAIEKQALENSIIKDELKDINNVVTKYNTLHFYDVDKVKNCVILLDKQYVVNNEKRVTLNKLNDDIQLYYDTNKDIKVNDTLIVEYKKELPALCPLCGKPLEQHYDI